MREVGKDESNHSSFALAIPFAVVVTAPKWFTALVVPASKLPGAVAAAAGSTPTIFIPPPPSVALVDGPFALLLNGVASIAGSAATAVVAREEGAEVEVEEEEEGGPPGVANPAALFPFSCQAGIPGCRSPKDEALLLVVVAVVAGIVAEVERDGVELDDGRLVVEKGEEEGE